MDDQVLGKEGKEGKEVDQTLTYVFDGTEVRMTGRQAKKAGVQKEHLLYEVTPIDEMQGGWKRWVRLTDLYSILPSSAEVVNR